MPWGMLQQNNGNAVGSTIFYSEMKLITFVTKFKDIFTSGKMLFTSVWGRGPKFNIWFWFG